jgi:hypothetical protein
MAGQGPQFEQVPPNEREATQKIIALLKQRLEREYPAGTRTLRDAHPKQHGLVRAEFIIQPNLPEDLRVGLFAEEKTYPAWVRFSNMSDPPQSDITPDSRGMAIKVMGVNGEKLLEGQKEAPTHDFVLMSTNFFVTKGVQEFADLVQALEGGMWKLISHLVFHPRLLLLFLRVRKKCANLLETRFGSTTPYQFGNRAVKYAARPTIVAVTTMPENPTPNFLPERLAAQLLREAVSFDFLVQFQTDTRSMPIEDPRVVWSEEASPQVKLATIRIPIQEFDIPAQNEYGDNLSFTPWHCLPAHRPLGGINRARKHIYEQMSAFRHARNAASLEEPSGWKEFGTGDR